MWNNNESRRWLPTFSYWYFKHWRKSSNWILYYKIWNKAMRKIIKQSLIFAKYFLKYKKRIKHRYVQVWIRLEGIHIESIVSPSHWWRVTTRETRAFNGERVTGITSLRLILNLVRHSEDFFVYLRSSSTLDRQNQNPLFIPTPSPHKAASARGPQPPCQQLKS